MMTFCITLSIIGWDKSAVIPSRFGVGKSGDAKSCAFCSGDTIVKPAASPGEFGRLDGLALELELSLDYELKLGGSSALLACSNSILNLSDTSSVEDRLPPLRDGVTGTATLPLPVMLACLRCTTI